MTQSEYTRGFINLFLSWLKAIANWVLKLFNLAGSTGFSPLAWMSRNWLRLLILLLILGVFTDWLVWMIRWRPYWRWFKLKRIVVNDDELVREDGSDDVMETSYKVESVIEQTRKRPSTMRPKRETIRKTSSSRTTREERDFFADSMFEIGKGENTEVDLDEDAVFDVDNLPKRPFRRGTKRKQGRSRR